MVCYSRWQEPHYGVAVGWQKVVTTWFHVYPQVTRESGADAGFPHFHLKHSTKINLMQRTLTLIQRDGRRFKTDFHQRHGSSLPKAIMANNTIYLLLDKSTFVEGVIFTDLKVTKI